MSNNKPPLIVHIIHRLDVGGLENGLVNLLNNLPESKYRHAIVCLTESSDFAKRIKRKDIDIYELHKREGNDLRMFWRLWKLLRKIKPFAVHTRNISALESGVVAALAGVKIRIHGEHGRDIYDLHGKNKKHRFLRRICSPFLHRFIALSKDLEQWLIKDIGISRKKVVQLYNGVNTDRFTSTNGESEFQPDLPAGFDNEDSIIIGTVGRLEQVKDQLTLVKAFIKLLDLMPADRSRLKLILIGDGSCRSMLKEQIQQADIGENVWVAGNREDVPQMLRKMDVFVLPSLGEGISNTILEAMASGLPVVATRVGGNPELVDDGVTGKIVPSADASAMADALSEYIRDINKIKKHGDAGRARVEEIFSLSAMVRRYECIYDSFIENTASQN